MNLADYADWSAAYCHFNDALFDGQLPVVAFTWQRHAKARGYASMNRFAGRDGAAPSHELAMNPDHFLRRSDLDTLSTLVHEQCHIWQYCHGKPSRKGHHNVEWGTVMERVGLMPSSTGEPGGKRTGQKMTHYVIEGGPFALAAAELLATGWRIKRGSLPDEAKAKADRSKMKFTCPKCQQNAWAKWDAALICGFCQVMMDLPERPPGLAAVA
jgi:predicted SprT family Zn-dependent metalloprotease